MPMLNKELHLRMSIEVYTNIKLNNDALFLKYHPYF